MKVYVITKGCYSDYHICAVTTNPDEAEVLKTKFSSDCWGSARIEEYDTDKYNDILANKNLYLVSFATNGDITDIHDTEDIDWVSDEISIYNDNKCLIRVFAFNEESAIKIASEKRAVALARRQGIS